MNAGHLRHRLVFQSNTSNTLSASGEVILSYSTQFTVWGAIEQAQVMPEVHEGDRVAPVQQIIITIRERGGVNAGQRILHKRGASTLFAGINASATSVVIAEPLPFELGSDDYLLIDNEIVRVTAGGTGTTLTIERGALNTTAASHSTGAVATRVQAYEVLGVNSATRSEGIIELSARRVG